MGPPPGPPHGSPAGPPPPGPPGMSPHDEDPPVHPNFVVAVQHPDGGWLEVRSKHAASAHFWPAWAAAWLLGIGGVIAALSIFTARRLMLPLDRLTEAARRLGVARAVEPVAETGPAEFRAIARAFNDMTGRLKRFVDDRTQMVAAISHDLRTPLTRMRLRAEDVTDTKTQARLLADIAEMEAMIEATLVFAAEESRREPMAPVDLAVLLSSLCDDRVDAGSRAEYAGPAHYAATCQPTAMRRALTNLVINACTHGRAARVALAEREDAVVVTIADEGPGIAPDQVEHAFAPFRRLEPSRNRATGGVGLGLTVARSIVRAHGGDIALRNGSPCGLVATVTLPKPAAT